MKRIALSCFTIAALCFVISCNSKSKASTTDAPAALTNAQLKDTMQKSFSAQLTEMFAGKAQLQELTIDTFSMVTEHDRMEAMAKKFSDVAARYDTLNLKQVPKPYWHQIDSLKISAHHMADSLNAGLPKLDNTDKKYYKIHFNLKVMTPNGPQSASETTFLDKNYKMVKF